MASPIVKASPVQEVSRYSYSSKAKPRGCLPYKGKFRTFPTLDLLETLSNVRNSLGA